MKKAFILLMVACALVFAFVGCASNTEPEVSSDTSEETVDSSDAVSETESATAEVVEKVKIGVSLAQNTQFYKLIQNAIEATADELGNVDLIILNADDDSATQLNDVDNLITQQVDGIIFSPVDKDSVGSAVDAAKDAGIPVVEVISSTTNDRYDVLVGCAEYDAGKMQADYIMENVGESGKMVVLLGIMGQSPQIDRLAGLKENLGDGWEILAEQTGEWSRDKGLQIMEDWLQKYPEVNVVAAQNDEMALGAIQAIQAEGRDDIVVLGVDGTADALQAIKSGTMAMSPFQNAEKEGRESLMILVDLLNGQTYDQAFTIPFEAITIDNVDEYISE